MSYRSRETKPLPTLYHEDGRTLPAGMTVLEVAALVNAKLHAAQRWEDLSYQDGMTTLKGWRFMPYRVEMTWEVWKPWPGYTSHQPQPRQRRRKRKPVMRRIPVRTYDFINDAGELTTATAKDFARAHRFYGSSMHRLMTGKHVRGWRIVPLREIHRIKYPPPYVP